MAKDLIEKLDSDLHDYDLILLVSGADDHSAGGMMGRLINSRAFRTSTKKILVLPVDKYKELVSLYHTYEFSDRFKVIGRDHQFGGLFNYVDNGLLTEDEAFELILG